MLQPGGAQHIRRVAKGVLQQKGGSGDDPEEWAEHISAADSAVFRLSPDFREMRIAGWEQVIRGAMEGETRMTENGALVRCDRSKPLENP